MKLARVKAGSSTGSGAPGAHADYAVLAGRIREQFHRQGQTSIALAVRAAWYGQNHPVAEQMAVELQVAELLIITVSDFLLAGGAAEVEARAKGVFQVLQEQQDIIILFRRWIRLSC